MHENYEPQEIRLAREIAEALDDTDSLEYHLQTVRKYKEIFLRKKLQKVLSIPEHKIKKSRAALYTYLINQHERNGNDGN